MRATLAVGLVLMLVLMILLGLWAFQMLVLWVVNLMHLMLGLTAL